MSQPLENINFFRQRRRAEIDAEIERMAREQGVVPFDFNQAINDRKDEWTEEDEKAFEEFMQWRRKDRAAGREQKEKWLS